MIIHPTAIISPKAILGANVQVGAYTIIHDNVEIGANSQIGAFCELGISNHLSEQKKLIIGEAAHIRSHSIFYEGSVFGEQLVTGHRVTVREKVVAGKNIQIGTLCDLQGHCSFGDYVRLHSNVHIGQHSKIGNFVWIFPYVVLTNDPHPPSDTMLGVTIKDFAAIATMSVLLPGAVIEEGCLVGASSSVKGNTEAHCIYVGNPAKNVGSTSRIKLENGQPAYPWTTHFKRGYPKDITDQWTELR